MGEIIIGGGKISAETVEGLEKPLTVEIDDEGKAVLRVVDVGGLAYDTLVDAKKISRVAKVEHEVIFNANVEPNGDIAIEDIQSKGADVISILVQTSRPSWTVMGGVAPSGDWEGTARSVDNIYPPMGNIPTGRPSFFRMRGM